MSNLDFPAGSYEEFIEILKTKPSLAPLVDGQVMEGLNIFQNLALEYGLSRIERARQEGYLSTSLNRSSILALSEDRLYVPRKATPSNGPLKIENKSGKVMGIPANTQLVTSSQVYYMTGDAVEIPANGEAYVTIRQLKPESISFDVPEEVPFLEFLLDRQLSKNIAELNVFVDMGLGFVEWQQAVMFRNTNEQSRVFDEFYSHTDQVGIRFGNGIYGVMPPHGSTVRVDVMLTEGFTELMPNQKMLPVIADFNSLEFTTAGTVSGGADQEDAEEIRRNAKYYSLYDEEVVWNGDYRFFILRKHPGINWLAVWGEQEMEEMEGAPDPAYINKIFFTAYSPDEPDINDKILESLEQLPPLNRRYEPILRVDHAFVVEIAGTLTGSVPMEDATQQIEATLDLYYGKDSSGPEGAGRREQVQIRELYSLMNGLGIFSDEDDIEIEVVGNSKPENLKQMLFVDLEESIKRLDLSY